MIRMIRISILLIVPIMFWGGSYLVPSVLKSENLTLLAGIVTALWGLDFIFFQKLGAVTNLNLLSSRDLALLNDRFSHIRQRVWYMAGICFSCSLLIWLIAAGQLISDVHVIAIVVGFLFAICIQYIAVFPFWFNELQAFQDRLKTSEAEKTKRDSMLKQMADAAKSN